ncbi:putative spermidine/putrescine transport system permease protein [Actinoplanes campanulatus]|uniref:Putative spermidine/putrescine transport system permease protein n=1 Tax=Actinoplanes campanulatus TaxID=113559 RepID=A0A7W5FDN3_9ACTN|nr:ABC transporter permease [Actinoplanes campanulatus]MBB3094614.1 putative spermidine/putrescine transport system permease protein [Actinoplanes campanulatus]GGN06325.1 spermidine/putrescine ABC transporter permease [Actinoplanes campanulatus]GID35910.1 spermidine/putrescine ABC transporter permease [Actinoplanes campanulatus]
MVGLGSYLHRHPRLRLAGLLSAPLLWLVVAYLGALAVLLVSAFWTVNGFTGEVVRQFSLGNFRTILTEEVYRNVALRSVGVAAAVTVICVVVAVPMAFFMAKVASARSRHWLVIAILTPLWASYLVKAYAWRILLANNGPMDTLFDGPGYGLPATVLVLAYMWLPYMILPVYAGLERLPDSLLEASADLGARAGRTFRSVVLPTLVPSVFAGSIFTFSLSLGDYITVQIVGGKTQLIGNLVYANIGAANNLPFAAAIATVPVLIMVIYLLAVRRSGALEEL